MKKNLFNRTSVLEIIARAEKLNAHLPPLWGTMNATEMLFHCNLANTQILEEHTPFQKSTMKQRLLKILGLYLMSQFPKNKKGAKKNDTKGHIDESQFQIQLNNFKNILLRFPGHKKSIILIHPAFGNLTQKEWGIAAWMHIDHHLRQFGV